MGAFPLVLCQCAPIKSYGTLPRKSRVCSPCVRKNIPERGARISTPSRPERPTLFGHETNRQRTRHNAHQKESAEASERGDFCAASAVYAQKLQKEPEWLPERKTYLVAAKISIPDTISAAHTRHGTKLSRITGMKREWFDKNASKVKEDSVPAYSTHDNTMPTLAGVSRSASIDVDIDLPLLLPFRTIRSEMTARCFQQQDI